MDNLINKKSNSILETDTMKRQNISNQQYFKCFCI